MIDDDDLSLSSSTTPSPTVPYPKGQGGAKEYLALGWALFGDARRHFGVGPFIAVAAEAFAVPLLLLAIQAAILAVASSFQLDQGTTMLGVRGVGFEVSSWTAAAVVLVAGGSSGLLSFYARSRINKYAVRYEKVCSTRAVTFHLNQKPETNLKHAIAAVRVDSRSCGSALRLLLLSLPWSLALVLILPLLLIIQWQWTLILGLGGLVAGYALFTLNRRTVRATRQFDVLRDSSGLELASILRARTTASASTDPSTWQELNAQYLDAFEHRLQIPVRTQAVTTVLFAISLAVMVPLITLDDSARSMNLLVLIFYLILLRVGFGYLGRVATLIMSFNQQFPMVRRYMLTVLRPVDAAVPSVQPKDQVGS